MSKMLTTRSEVLAAMAASENSSTDEMRVRLSVAGYLAMLAEQVRQGTIDGFEVAWQTGSETLDAKIRPKRPVGFVELDVVHSPPCRSK